MAYKIPGANIPAATAIANQTKAAIEAAKPTFEGMLNSIKSGAIFKSVESQLSSLTSALTSSGASTSAVDSIKSTVQSAQDNLAIDMALAKASVDIQAKIALSKGQSLDAATVTSLIEAPFAVLKNAQSMASSAASIAASGASNVANLQSQISNAGGSVDPGLTQQLNNAKAAVSIGATNAAGDFSALASSASASKADTISTLKANAMLASLSRPMIPALSTVTGSCINTSQIDPYNAIKAQETPVIPALPISQRPPIDPIRPGSATLIRELPPSTVSSENNKRIWSYELNQLKAEATAAYKAYRESYGSNIKATKEESQATFTAWVENLWIKLNGAESNEIRKQSVAIKQAKPNVADRTPEEIEITEKSKKGGEALKSSPEYINVNTTLYGKYSQLIDWHKELYDNWLAANDRFILKKEILDKISSYKS